MGETLYANNEAYLKCEDGTIVKWSDIKTINETRIENGLPPVEDPKPISMKLTGNSIIDKIHLEMGE